MAARDGSSILWFLTGISIGTAVGILYAPRSGSETREIFQSKVDEGREFVRKQASDLRDQASELVEKGSGVLKQQKDRIRADSKTGFQEVRSENPSSAPNS
jgi:gas vesicle protein